MSLNYDVAEAFARYGYDPDNPVCDLEIRERLLEDVGIDETLHLGGGALPGGHEGPCEPPATSTSSRERST